MSITFHTVFALAKLTIQSNSRETNLLLILISRWSRATSTYLLRTYMDPPLKLWISSRILVSRFWTSVVELDIYLVSLLRFSDPNLSTTVRISLLLYLSFHLWSWLASNFAFHSGIELHDDVIDHCKISIAKWRPATVESRIECSTFHFEDATADIHIIKGNGLNILKRGRRECWFWLNLSRGCCR